MTNQWHFYVVTNTTLFTNAAFITFGAAHFPFPEWVYLPIHWRTHNARSRPGPAGRRGAQPTPVPSNLLNLDPIAVSNCVNGVNGDGASLVSGGTDFVAYTNVPPNEVYYIGVKSESHMAVEYDFIPIFTDVPFGTLDQNGNETSARINVPSVIPDGTRRIRGCPLYFSLALYPIAHSKRGCYQRHPAPEFWQSCRYPDHDSVSVHSEQSRFDDQSGSARPVQFSLMTTARTNEYSRYPSHRMDRAISAIFEGMQRARAFGN